VSPSPMRQILLSFFHLMSSNYCVTIRVHSNSHTVNFTVPVFPLLIYVAVVVLYLMFTIFYYIIRRNLEIAFNSINSQSNYTDAIVSFDPINR
jgi:hypothetical protein